MKRTLTWIGASVLGVLAPVGVAFATDLFTGPPGRFLFDIADTQEGYVSGGTNDAYDFMYYLDVDGVAYDADGAPPTLSLGGRQVEMAEIPMGSLQVRRLAYVPASGGNWIRYVDVLRNPTASPVTATVQIRGSLGADTTFEITGSSTGDTRATIEDNWITTDDSSAMGGDTPTGHVMQGASGQVRVDSVVAGVVGIDDVVRWELDVTVPPMDEVAVLTYGIQEADRASTITTAALLADPACAPSTGTDPLMGLDAAMRAKVVNFALAGAPIACFDTVAEVPEGDSFMVDVTVSDFEGDPSVSWTWDLDGDGTFDDMPDATNVTIPAGLTDGPGVYEVGIEVTDGTNTRQAFANVNVTNVEPQIVSAAPRMAGIRREYRYEVMVDDPAGALDPITYTLASRPTGMMVDSSGVITWTPGVDTRGTTVPVILTVNDGDGGEDLEMWEIDVAQNNQPNPPVPVSPTMRDFVDPTMAPTLVVENAVDPDGDPLTYFFRLSRTTNFDGGDAMGSGGLDEGADGTTSWTAPEPLEEGLWYWEVWVEDDIGRSDFRYGQFISGEEMAAMPDAGPVGLPDGSTGGVDAGPGDDDGGCSATPGAPGSGAGLLGLLGLAALALFRRRRGR